MKNIIILICLIFTFISCNKDKKKLTITDFFKKLTDTLKPSDYDKIYYGYTIKIKGYIGDTIKINGHKIAGGMIDKELSFEYYGREDVVLVFVPYKAKNGKIEIEHKLLG